MTVIDDILSKRRADGAGSDAQTPPHTPEMLLIGCVDARKDPTADLGIARGRALILRNIAALIRGTSVVAEQRETEAAALEFAVKVMKVKHIAVMGHTDCGGIRAALTNIELKDIRKYLSPLDELKQQFQASGKPLEEQATALEKEAVKMSVQNLLSYDYIRQAVDNGDLSLHGWVLNIASGNIEEIV